MREYNPGPPGHPLPPFNNLFMGAPAADPQDIDALFPQSHTTLNSSASGCGGSLSQGFANSPALAMQQFMPQPGAEDSRYSAISTASHSGLYAPQYSPPTSTASNAFPSYQTQYQPNQSSAFMSNGGGYYSQPAPQFAAPDYRSRSNPTTGGPALSFAARSTASILPSLESPFTTRSQYTGALPQQRRDSSFSRSSSESGAARNRLRDLSKRSQSPECSTTTSSTVTSPRTMDPGSPTPPLYDTETHCEIQCSTGQLVKPTIYGRIEKGFFMCENDWTCYRRNYFALSCSYSLNTNEQPGSLQLLGVGDNGPLRIHGFAMCIAAVMDARDGKTIDLVQHTPKRDKGPRGKPLHIALFPRAQQSNGLYGNENGFGSSRSIYDAQNYPHATNQPPTEATFERIQFQHATMNNGKRRAAQQYYHILIELYADVDNQHPDRYYKVASRISAPIVVRGRSPGHYTSTDRKNSDSNAGSGDSKRKDSSSNSMGYGSHGSNRGSNGSGMGVNSAMVSSSTGYVLGYQQQQNHHQQNQSHQNQHHHRHNIAPLHMPSHNSLGLEQPRFIEDSSCMWSPTNISSLSSNPTYADLNGEQHPYQLPRVTEPLSSSSYNRIKHEFSPTAGFMLPSLMANINPSRWDVQAQGDQKTYYPGQVQVNSMELRID